jgi:hypothetical protein
MSDKSATEPRNHRITIRTTVGGDINKTLRVQTFDLTATEWERLWIDRELNERDRTNRNGNCQR